MNQWPSDAEWPIKTWPSNGGNYGCSYFPVSSPKPKKIRVYLVLAIGLIMGFVFGYYFQGFYPQGKVYEVTNVKQVNKQVNK